MILSILTHFKLQFVKTVIRTIYICFRIFKIILIRYHDIFVQKIQNLM